MKKYLNLAIAAFAAAAFVGCGAGATRFVAAPVTEPGWTAHCPQNLPPEQPLICRYSSNDTKASVYVVQNNRHPELTTASAVALAYAQERARHGSSVGQVMTQTDGQRAEFLASSHTEERGVSNLLAFVQVPGTGKVIVAVAAWPTGDHDARHEAVDFVRKVSVRDAR